jgi:PHP family Zn ribbon phosphoesterase
MCGAIAPNLGKNLEYNCAKCTTKFDTAENENNQYQVTNSISSLAFPKQTLEQLTEPRP